VKFFETQGFKCPSNYNPADFYIKTLSISPTDRENCLEKVQVKTVIKFNIKMEIFFKKLSTLIKKICEGFQETDINEQIQKEVGQRWFSQINLNTNTQKIKPNSNSFKVNVFTQFRWLFWRNFIDQLRDPLSLRVLFIQTLVISLFSFKKSWKKIFYNCFFIGHVNTVWLHIFSIRSKSRRYSKH
jgi:hypothetical protein